MTDEIRNQITQAIADGSYQVAARLLSDFLREPLTSARASYVVSKLDEIGPRLGLPEVRIGFARSFTVEPLIPLLRARCFAAALDARVHVGDFGTYAQDLLDPDSSLVRFAPDFVVLAVRTPDLLPALWVESPEQDPRQEIDRVAREVESWILAFRRSSNAQVVIQGFELPPTLPRGVHDAQRPQNGRDAVWQLNRELRVLSQRHSGVWVLDYQGLIERHGRLEWHDERLWLLAGLPIAGRHLVHLADEMMRFVHPLTGRSAKVLVVDLDNTLWGGVVGEEGPQGIRVGADASGAPFLAVQDAILSLRHRGVLLAICSKNNPDDALAALQSHPEMRIRPADFSALRINWQDKAQNLREIASELNVGLDSLAFLDDSHVEREWVRSQVPEVFVLDCPDDPAERAAALLGAPIFERLSISAEDQVRHQLYAAERSRTESLQRAGSLGEFLASLRMSMHPSAIGSSTIRRVAQLTQKTNQFNLTTRRYAEQDIEAFAADPDAEVLAVRVEDRLGDSGIVGVAILCFDAGDCRIDTFLMSCRVIGRGVETALLWYCIAVARRHGAPSLLGTFLPTDKNHPASSFFADHGFKTEESSGPGTAWRLKLENHAVELPDWIEFASSQPLEGF